MKKTVTAITVVLAGFATVVQVAPRDNAWHTGAKLGWPQYHDTGFTLSNGPTHENQLGTGAFGGYQVNPYVGSEADYDWLGRMPYKDGSINGAYKARGVQLTAKLGYPITDDLDVYIRLGGMVWRADTKANAPGGASFKDHDTGISLVFAGGIEYTITPEIATRPEYQWTNDIGDVYTIGIHPDNGMLGLDVSYRFSQGEAAPVIAPAPALIPEVQTKHFTLKSNVLLNFNKAALKSEGQAALGQLHNQLSNLDLKDDPVVVLGYIGRIGFDAYNQGLSEHHVQSVVGYLISKGVPADKISARSMGESNSVTGNTCDDVKQRAALIDCLTPDRCARIKVKGIKDVIIQSQA